MNLTSWYYLLNQEVLGPVSKTEIQTLILNDTLKSSDMVWSLPLVDWKKISEVPELEQERFCVVPLPPSSTVFRSTDTQVLPIKTAATPTLGLRYGARLFDIYIPVFIICFAFRKLAPHVFHWHTALLCMCILLFCIVWEAFFLWKFGTTPGKWLIASSVMCFDGKRLSLKNALFRSFCLYINGCGFVILVKDFTSAFLRYNTTLKEWVPLWDRAANCWVIQTELDQRKLVTLYSGLAIFTLMLCLGFPR